MIREFAMRLFRASGERPRPMDTILELEARLRAGYFDHGGVWNGEILMPVNVEARLADLWGAEPRRGDWFTTYSGLEFYPYDPRPADVTSVDLAHALSQICRWGGQCVRFYSDAQHSVLVSRACHPAHALDGLLHDAEEAFGFTDLVRAVKHHPMLTPYRRAADLCRDVVRARFGLFGPVHPSIKDVDNIVWATEYRDVMNPMHGWQPDIPPLVDRIIPWSAERAEAEFLARLDELLTLRHSA